MPLINCEINLILTWSSDCVVIYANVSNQDPTFEITETKLYVPVVTLSTHDNVNLLRQLKSGFKITRNWNKYLSKYLSDYYWWKNVFDHPVKNNNIIYKNIRKTATGQGDDYTAGCLLDYAYFRDIYKMIAIDLSKQKD